MVYGLVGFVVMGGLVGRVVVAELVGGPMQAAMLLPMWYFPVILFCIFFWVLFKSGNQHFPSLSLSRSNPFALAWQCRLLMCIWPSIHSRCPHWECASSCPLPLLPKHHRSKAQEHHWMKYVWRPTRILPESQHVQVRRGEWGRLLYSDMCMYVVHKMQYISTWCVQNIC